ncbi:MAG: mevalonate kinase family protein [Bacteroidales bacterium]
MNTKFRAPIPAKIMLAGEYGVVIGGSALTVPFHHFHARIRDAGDIPSGKEGEASRSMDYLKQIFSYLSSISADRFHALPDLSRFEKNLEKYWLEMSIPVEYGLGSSGAVSAAIYRLFFSMADSLDLPLQKEDLALIESFFHGKSSGVDALTCFSNTSLHFKDDGSISPVEFSPSQIPGGYRFFLLDSGVKLETGPLVNRFLEKMKDPRFEADMREEYLLLNRQLIETLLGLRQADPAMLVRMISDFQWNHFRPMIPPSSEDLWIEGQVSNEYYLKLNGSGGGFMLGITHRDSTEALEERWGNQMIWID